MARRPILTMTVAVRPAGASMPTAEVPLDLAIREVKGGAYLALSAGDAEVLLTEPEAMALAAAIERLAALASAVDSARDHIGRSQAGGERA
jgi:hypothetical protein